MTNAQTGSDPFALVRFLTMKEVRALTTYTPQHIYRLERAGKFPNRVRIGQNRVGWRQSDLLKWMASRPVVLPPPGNPDQIETEI
jgi:prophage regulatory protein